MQLLGGARDEYDIRERYGIGEDETVKAIIGEDWYYICSEGEDKLMMLRRIFSVKALQKLRCLRKSLLS